MQMMHMDLKTSGHSWKVIQSYSTQTIHGRNDTVEERVNNLTGWSVLTGFADGREGGKAEELRACSSSRGRTCGSSKKGKYPRGSLSP